ncbi:MAG: ABC transporter permease, partial [Deltaproteobacteria bacterium CG17_big_fil_post_rev_8_21_14_2_50_51_6]
MQFFIESALSAFELIVSFDPEVYFIIWTSLRVALVALLFAALAGVPMGLLIALNRFTGKQAVLLVLNTLMALPTVVVGLFFYA